MRSSPRLVDDRRFWPELSRSRDRLPLFGCARGARAPFKIGPDLGVGAGVCTGGVKTAMRIGRWSVFVAFAIWIAALAPAGIQGAQAPSQAVPAPAAAASSPRAALDRYCVSCHNARLKTADLQLDTLDVAQIPAHANEWEKVIRK